MSDIVVVSGHPRPGSKTWQLAMAVGKRFATRRGQATFVTVDVAELGPSLLDPADGDTGQALLIVVTPTYQGSYSGALKVLLDQLPANALAGVLAVPVVTADVQARADATEAFLARLLSELGADVVDFGLTAIGPELADPAATADQYANAIAA